MNTKRKKTLFKALALSLALLTGVFLPENVKAEDKKPEIATWSGWRKSAVSFTFDDGAPSHVSDGAPLFDEFGYKATYYLVCNWNPDWEGFQTLADNGHEIGSHSNSHGQNMSGEEASSKANINGMIKQKYGCISVAYPNCNVPEKPENVLKHYVCGRICNGSWQSISDTMDKDGPSDWTKVPSLMTGSESSVKEAADFITILQDVIDNQQWVCFLTHGFTDKTNGSATYSPTDLDELRKTLEWVQKHDDEIWVAPLGYVAMYIKERKASHLEPVETTDSCVKYSLTHTLHEEGSDLYYNYPLSIRVPLPEGLNKPAVNQCENILDYEIKDGYVYFDAVPNDGDIIIAESDVTAFSVSLSDDLKGRKVSMITLLDGAKIHYTLDGTTPSAKSTEYTAPIIVPDSADATIKAVVIKDGIIGPVAEKKLTFHEITKAALPSHSVWGQIPDKAYEGEQVRFYLNVTAAEWDNGIRLRAIKVKDGAGHVTEITKCIMGAEMSGVTPKTDEAGNRNYVPQTYTMSDSDVEISADFVIDPEVAAKKAAEEKAKNENKDDGNTQQPAGPEAKGAKITDPDSKATFRVISGVGETPAVEYAKAPTQKNATITVPSKITFNGITYQVTAIGKEAFKNNKNVKTIVIPASVKKLSAYAFEGNHKITSIDLGEKITKIPEDTFYDCSALTKIVIGKTVTKISGNPFKYCSSLKSFEVDEENTKYRGAGPILYSKTGLTLYAYPSAKGSLGIPSGVKTIGEYAFCGSGLTELSIPANVKSISKGAFYDCADLEEVSFEKRKITLFEDIASTEDMIFGNAMPYLVIVLPYAKDSNQAGSVEEKLKLNAPSTVIIVNK